MSSKRKLVIDCDPGNDDAVAILMALCCSSVDVVAITCVEGNTNVKQAGLNALRTLQAANRLDIPIHLGVSSPMFGIFRPRDACISYHGKDAFGNDPYPNAPDESHFRAEHAVDTLLRLSQQFKGELELVDIGPLTNAAMAIRMDHQFGSRLKSCSIMGRNYHGKGNITAAAEFNFYFDPEAASVTLNELGCPITLVPWETCLKHAISWESFHLMRDTGTPIPNFVKKIETRYAYSKAKKFPKFVPADEALMACFLKERVIKGKSLVYATVELSLVPGCLLATQQRSGTGCKWPPPGPCLTLSRRYRGGNQTTVELRGELTWGQVVVDWDGLMKKIPNVTIVTDLDQSLYESIMLRAFNNSYVHDVQSARIACNV